jgi:hypothetical protein
VCLLQQESGRAPETAPSGCVASPTIRGREGGVTNIPPAPATSATRGSSPYVGQKHKFVSRIMLDPSDRRDSEDSIGSGDFDFDDMAQVLRCEPSLPGHCTLIKGLVLWPWVVQVRPRERELLRGESTASEDNTRVATANASSAGPGSAISGPILIKPLGSARHSKVLASHLDSGLKTSRR